MKLINRNICKQFKKADDLRDSKIPLRDDVIVYKSLSYSSTKKDSDHILDIIRKKDDDSILPCIVIVHGGGYVYGEKETYQRYAEYLATLGFVLVVYNYPHCPKEVYPYQLHCIDSVLSFIKENKDTYKIDTDNVFLVGDSAGGHMAFQYGIAYSNEVYRNLLGLSIPLKIKGIAMNCAMYDDIVFKDKDIATKYILKQLLGSKRRKEKKDIYEFNKYLNSSFPPSFILTAENDFLKEQNINMDKRFTELNIPHKFHLYESNRKDKLGHVFHCNVIDPVSVIANNDEADFFKSLINK